jgi:hypothetical protein
MSVVTLEYKEINSIAKTLIASEKKLIKTVQELPYYRLLVGRSVPVRETYESFIGRMVWYLYCANITAYNVNYQENVPIFNEQTKNDEYLDKDLSFAKAISRLGSLIYNCYTNAGNYFIADGWIDSAIAIRKAFDKTDEYAKGGEVENIDLFEYYEQQPKELRAITQKWDDKFMEGDSLTYEDMADFLKEVEAIGYTFDCGLDNEPYGLRKKGIELNELKGWEDMAKGGEVAENVYYALKEKGKSWSETEQHSLPNIKWSDAVSKVKKIAKDKGSSEARLGTSKGFNNQGYYIDCR